MIKNSGNDFFNDLRYCDIEKTIKKVLTFLRKTVIIIAQGVDTLEQRFALLSR